MFLSLVLAFFPSLDIKFSNIFYTGNKQFLIKHYLTGNIYFYEYIIRRAFLPLLVIFMLFFPVVLNFLPKIKKKFPNLIFRTTDIFFIWASAAILSIVVNNVLKNGLGRSRPNDIVDFGGSGTFSSWIEYSTECASNCSFVSGDASVGFFIASFYYISKRKFYFFASLVVGMFLGLTRVAAGAHFLSDILMAFIVVNLVLKILHMVYYGMIKWKKA